MNNKVENIDNWINGHYEKPTKGLRLEKYNPHSGELISLVADSTSEDFERALMAARNAFSDWSNTSPVARGKYLFRIAEAMKDRKKILAECVAIETGKSLKDASGEVEASISQAEFFAGEGMRLFGKSLPSGVSDKYSHTVRQPLGVAALIVPANTPIANIAWKLFPALVCGNTAIVKASENAPKIANLIAEITDYVELPVGVLNIIHGQGSVVGEVIVADARINVISFTGSTNAGKRILQLASSNLTRVSLELGGKNPFVVCDDADLEQAAHWAVLSAFSNAGQRCAAGSRILVFESVYEKFMELFIGKTKNLKLGVTDECDLGPLINKSHQRRVLDAIDRSRPENEKLICGGNIPDEIELKNGYYVEPTIFADLPLNSELIKTEIFGPVVTVNAVKDFNEAIEQANSTSYGLTAAIHTKSVDRAMHFAQKIRSGVVNINLGTYGSEPHMPFGGFGDSGNGTREPGTEALDVYSELKNISFLVRKDLL